LVNDFDPDNAKEKYDCVEHLPAHYKRRKLHYVSELPVFGAPVSNCGQGVGKMSPILSTEKDIRYGDTKPRSRPEDRHARNKSRPGLALMLEDNQKAMAVAVREMNSQLKEYEACMSKCLNSLIQF
jgi:hypothetical protein